MTDSVRHSPWSGHSADRLQLHNFVGGGGGGGVDKFDLFFLLMMLLTLSMQL